MAATTSAQKVLQRALELSVEERVRLAYALLGSADEPDEAWWASVEPEVDEISAAIASGAMKTVPWEVVQRQIAERLSRHGG